MPGLTDEFMPLLAEAMEHLHDPSIRPYLQTLQQRYDRWDATEKIEFFTYLARNLESPLATDPDAIAAVPGGFDLDCKEDIDRLLALREQWEPPRLHLLRQFVNLPGGIKFLVDMRAELRELMRVHRQAACLRLVEADLLHLFRSWFNFGFLQLVPIRWETTSAAQLEKLMAYEVVHPMSEWETLRQRLDRDRLCYALYHPNMPDEPLIFLEIALTQTIGSSIDRLFQQRRVRTLHEPSVALFYSINATQKGLSGISLGNSLIKMAVEQLRQDYPSLRRFSTLSPMPGFRKYLHSVLQDAPEGRKRALYGQSLDAFFDPEDLDVIRRAVPGVDALPAQLNELLAGERWREPELCYPLKGGLLRLAHFYVVHEKRRGAPLDPVAHFHFRNGAMLYNLNYLSDTSAKGISESFGMTANYLYALDKIDDHQRRFHQGQCVVTPQLDKMLQLGISA
ncbi:malonyl-CoA decarboxylase domain-containing protein [Phycisphaerales bacterium AB-hyl4]|uniref:Malonyl-CoA decarboxylase domain-containing protein n=1 Tax=Natronomicrosphaera hydrolytica TaxID=3242702 RepID=A0ABV4U467_9BACT